MISELTDLYNCVGKFDCKNIPDQENTVYHIAVWLKELEQSPLLYKYTYCNKIFRIVHIRGFHD